MVGMTGNHQDEPTNRQGNMQSKRGVRQLKNRKRNRELRRLQEKPSEDDQQAKPSMMTVGSATSALSDINREIRGSVISAENIFVYTNARLEQVDVTSSIQTFLEEDFRAADWELLGNKLPTPTSTLLLSLPWSGTHVLQPPHCRTCRLPMRNR